MGLLAGLLALLGSGLSACSRATSAPPATACSTQQFTPPSFVTALVQPQAVASAQRPPQADYRWQNVAISGMGFVTGVVLHPRQPDLVYIRTDVGGVYRWNPTGNYWLPLLEGIDHRKADRYGIESLAIDPSNPEVVYIASGGGFDDPGADILKSRDRGTTWHLTNLRTPAGKTVRMGGNDPWRWAGERLMVDPNNGQVVYFGSRRDGLYRSLDGAKTWSHMATFPRFIRDDQQITFVAIDPNSRATHSNAKSSQTIYVGMLHRGLYRSRDAGKTWELFNPPARDASKLASPQRAEIAPDGTLYVTTMASEQDLNGDVWKLSQNTWKNITPKPGRNYGPIALDPKNLNHLLVAEYPFTPEALYRSTDGGTHWRSLNLAVQTPPWFPQWHLYTPTGGLQFDPHHINRVWLTNGFGVLRSDQIHTTPTPWCFTSNHLEELVVFVIKSPPLQGGASLLSGVADVSGFRHASLTQVPQATLDGGEFGDTTGIDFVEADPNWVVRVGSHTGDGGREDSQPRAAYSNDNGQTWTQFTHLPPGSVNGKVAVSATLQPNGSPIIVWAPQAAATPIRSLDAGLTWEATQGAPQHTTPNLWSASQAIASDRVDGNLFYLYQYNDETQRGSLYRSQDGGRLWQRTVENLPSSPEHALRALPGRRGDLWLRVSGQRLYRSQTAGESFLPVVGVEAVKDFSFGKPAAGHTNPTLFVYGTINGEAGLYRSEDATRLAPHQSATWVKVSIPEQQLGNLLYLEGDRRVFGRVYVATGGRGILYGEPKDKSR
jgi:xyloglucan-specific exo-beta-1,4-glucanase